jgi:hypothetical protein
MKMVGNVEIPQEASWLYCGLGRNKIAISSSKNNWKRVLPGLIVSVVALLVIFSMLDFKKFKLVLLQNWQRILLHLG